MSDKARYVRLSKEFEYQLWRHLPNDYPLTRRAELVKAASRCAEIAMWCEDNEVGTPIPEGLRDAR